YPTPAVQWQQSFDAGVTWSDIPGQTNLTYTHTILEAGFYYYRYLLANGEENLASNKCRVVSNIKIVEVVPKRWDVTDTICAGSTYFIGDTSYTDAGVYIDSLISTIGCDSIVTLTLDVIPDQGITIDPIVTDPNCPGDLGTVNFGAVQLGSQPYTYFIDDTLVFTEILDVPLPPGRYRLRANDRFQCMASTEVTISPALDFMIDLGPDQNIALGESVRFGSSANDEIAELIWTPPLPNCPPECSTSEITPIESATYRLDAISVRGCPASDSVFINVRTVRQVYIPNAFSPNFDGVNDRFLPLVNTPNVQEILRFQVFNRWGDLIFDRNNIQPNITTAGWDGTFNGRPVEAGVYTYVVQAVFLDGFVGQYTGDVTVLP
ncbi:MAG: gliding motility-associated C-terminal domain-containing protein, partial [Bacteroidota bacterium]